MKYRIFLISLIVLYQINAQNNCVKKIQFLVLKPNKTICANAEIFIEKTHGIYNSDENGKCAIALPCNSWYEIEIHSSDYLHNHLTIYAIRDTTINIILEFDSSANYITVSQKMVKYNVINSSTLSKLTHKNIAQMLDQIPGCSVLKSGNSIGKPMVNGFYGMRLPVINNNTLLVGQQWANDHGLEAASATMDKIEIVQGPQAFLQSGSINGGILLLKNTFASHHQAKEIENNAFYFSNGRGFGNSIKYKSNIKIPVFFNYAVQRSGNYATPQYILNNTAFFESAGNIGFLKANKKIIMQCQIHHYYGKNAIMQASKIGSISDLLLAISNGKPSTNGNFSYEINRPFQQTSQHHAEIIIDYKKQNGTLKQTHSFQINNRKEYDYHRNSSIVFPQLDLQMISNSNTIERYMEKGKNQFTLKLQNQIYSNKYYSYFLIPNAKGMENSGIILHLYSYKKVHIENAIRIENRILNASWIEKNISYNKTTNFTGISGGTKLIYQIKKITVEMHVMRTWRAPWLNELYSNGVHHGSASFEKGNENVKAESSINIQHKIEYTGKYLYVLIQNNFSRFNNYILLTPDLAPVLTVRGAFPTYSYKQFNAINNSASGIIEYKVYKNLIGKVQYQKVTTKNIDNNTYTPFIPPARLLFGIEYNLNNFSIDFQNVHVLKQLNYTANTDYSPPPNEYNITNIYLKIWNKKILKNNVFTVGIENTLNQEYKEYLDRFRYFAHAPKRNIVIHWIYKFHHHDSR